MDTKRMPYRQYKSHYADCEIVPDSYDKASRSIEVLIPDGRIKPSGVRGERFHRYQLWMTLTNGKRGYCTYRAVSKENAMKQHLAWCAKNGWEPDKEAAL